MIASVIPIYVIVLCNMSHKRYINHSKESILMDKADLYEKCSAGIRKGFVNYYVDCELEKRKKITIISFIGDPDFEEYLRFRETRKTLQQAADDAVLVRKQK
ncbi:hypothetical protein CAEBREN_10878 [Caenorhabditis brenneri]|uniref:Uncharacterized protein n=1 Tax=Caenorhabditis brenneri TaxID=135651 RepID=G0MK97_CAEBE|nr:hypothetical protein CAEBREN_10878 [Caenorhabditis brenneri]